MKTRILSLVIALIALFTFSNAFAQSCHQVGKLSITAVNGDDIQLSGKIAGLGNVNEEVLYELDGELTGTFECVPPGQKKKGDEGSVAPGQTTFSYSGSGSGIPRNGSLTFKTTQDSDCNENFNLRISGATFHGTLTIYSSSNPSVIYCTVTIE